MTEKRGATEQEAIAAQQVMFTLLAKHNLEISQMPDDEPTRPDTTINSRFRHSFAEGCASRIYERLEEMRLEAQAGRMKSDDPHSLLPALTDLYQSSSARVDDFITAHFGKLHHRTHYAGGGHNGGYVTGYNAGDKVGLHRQVIGKRAHKSLTHG